MEAASAPTDEALWVGGALKGERLLGEGQGLFEDFSLRLYKMNYFSLKSQISKLLL